MTGRLEILICAAEPLRLPPEDGVCHWRVVDTLPSLRDDTEFHGGWAAARDTLENAVHRLRLSLSADSMTRAHALAASALDSLAAQLAAPEICAVVDLFSLDARPLPTAAKRLREGPLSAWIWIGIRPSTTAGVFDLESFGLRKAGLREVHVPAVAERHVAGVVNYLNMLLRYVVTTGKRLNPGDATSFGWVDVRLVAAESLASYPDQAAACVPRFIREVCAGDAPLPGVAVACEPLDDSDAAPLRCGVARASRLIEQLAGAAKQCGLGEELPVPRGNSTTIVCKRVSQGPPIDARRLVPEASQSSGWVAVCGDDEHDHESAENFEVVPLKQLAAAVPRLFAMLAAPPGTGLTVYSSGELTIRFPLEEAAEVTGEQP